MEGYLLDTHIWLWSVLEPERLESQIRELLASEGSVLFLSSVSVWEAVLLGERGRIVMKPDPITWSRETLAHSPIQEAPLNHEIAFRSRTLETNLSDPADRFILATASVYNLTLLSMDKEIQKCKDVKIRAR